MRTFEGALFLVFILRASQLLDWMAAIAHKLLLPLKLKAECGSYDSGSVEAACAGMLHTAKARQMPYVFGEGALAYEAFPSWVGGSRAVGLFVGLVAFLAIDSIVGGYFRLVGYVLHLLGVLWF